MLQLQPSEWPRWTEMWALAFALYFGCKWLTWQQAVAPDAAVWRHLGYLFAWPGMDATSFLTQRLRADRSTGLAEPLAAVLKVACGVVLLFGAARLVPEEHSYLAGCVGGAGLVLILHFGVLHLLSCAWRSAGIATRPLMQRPLAATSLGDFWGRRWNTAFRDLTHRLIFRPCASRFGARAGLIAAFLFSGAVHDLVISLPARGGYGGPTIYFAIQGIGVLIERSEFGRTAGLQSGITARVFAFLILLAPVASLFHRPFMLGVLVPFMRTLGAL